MKWPLRARTEGALPRGALGQRLTRVALAAAGLALLVTGSVLNLVMIQQAREALIDETTTQARVIAANLGAALLFQDARAAAEMLATLQQSSGVQRAAVFDARGVVFAHYQRPGTPETAALLPNGAGPPGHTLGGGLLVVNEPIEQAGVQIGRIRFEVPLTPLHRRAWIFGGVTVGAAALAMALAYLLAVGVRRDVGRIERRLDELAYLDPVTLLYNRHASHAHLASYVTEADRTGQGFSIITIDLDDFKAVNDSLGHPMGDELLRRIAQRLQQALKPGARAYRFGGDEFVMICPWQPGFHEPQRYGALAQEVLGASVRLGGIDTRLRGSIGVARYPVDGSGADEVLLASDMAMYQAKAAGKNQVAVFHAGLRELNEQRLRIESELRIGLREGQLCLHYQPIVDLAGGQVLGAEALLRWRHPQRGLISPAQFIPLAERSGLIVELGEWVFHEAARQLQRWATAGMPPLPVAVNVSARQLREGLLLQQFEQAMAASGCDPTLLEIELTEHTLVEDVDDNLRLLHALRERGVRVAIDDFGTGLSSLSYLKRLPATKLKIDRSFVRDLPDDRGDVAIVEAALSMAQALGLQVVAEGVETEAQRQLLARLGCHAAQGFLYSPALEPDAFAHWCLQHQRGRPAIRTARVSGN
ncbi:putative bifunctional diguanylate cyclase/phosphodiesterase [Aquabacterium sp.]|uniref:putative bifunctional diguanylate cyclase/phosphodiesterase n=1 Tax=Aquabacterium sp. TaxID=1872578 RepID=UPI003783EABA